MNYLCWFSLFASLALASQGNQERKTEDKQIPQKTQLESALETKSYGEALKHLDELGKFNPSDEAKQGLINEIHGLLNKELITSDGPISEKFQKVLPQAIAEVKKRLKKLITWDNHLFDQQLSLSFGTLNAIAYFLDKVCQGDGSKYDLSSEIARQLLDSLHPRSMSGTLAERLGEMADKVNYGTLHSFLSVLAHLREKYDYDFLSFLVNHDGELEKEAKAGNHSVRSQLYAVAGLRDFNMISRASPPNSLNDFASLTPGIERILKLLPKDDLSSRWKAINEAILKRFGKNWLKQKGKWGIDKATARQVKALMESLQTALFEHSVAKLASALESEEFKNFALSFRKIKMHELNLELPDSENQPYVFLSNSLRIQKMVKHGVPEIQDSLANGKSEMAKLLISQEVFEKQSGNELNKLIRIADARGLSPEEKLLRKCYKAIIEADASDMLLRLNMKLAERGDSLLHNCRRLGQKVRKPPTPVLPDGRMGPLDSILQSKLQPMLKENNSLDVSGLKAQLGKISVQDYCVSVVDAWLTRMRLEHHNHPRRDEMEEFHRLLVDYGDAIKEEELLSGVLGWVSQQ